MEAMTIRQFIERRKAINNEIMDYRRFEREEVAETCRKCRLETEEQKQNLKTYSVYIKDRIEGIQRHKKMKLVEIHDKYANERMNLDLKLRELDATFYEQRRMKYQSLEGAKTEEPANDDTEEADLIDSEVVINDELTK